ncbi:MAG: SH3 domain-containing protein [Dehalococcoidia bacterium]|nr:SH3 domain-containing protein [Dehalococcoidia bacterium]
MRGFVAQKSLIRGLLVLLVVALAAPVLVMRAQPAQAQEEENGPIARVALSYLGTHGGQCWTFMQQVVMEATGRKVGYDYRQGYFEAGAIEVSAAEARNGDIIQIASDSNSGAYASYPGLHTAIILSNLGNGRFNAVDSNQNWDEWVRLRPNYDPYASAARNGLQVHIYRIPGGGPGESGVSTDVSAPAAGGAVASGDSAVVAADGGCLNLRSAPGLSSGRVDCLPSGTGLTITGEAVAKDGFSWVPVSSARGSGWVASRYVTKTASAVADAAPAAPAAEPEPEPELAVAPPAPEPAVSAAGGIPARTDGSPGCLRVRTKPDISAGVVDCLAPNTPVTMVDGAGHEADGYTWVHITGRADGWVASEFLDW